MTQRSAERPSRHGAIAIRFLLCLVVGFVVLVAVLYNIQPPWRSGGHGAARSTMVDLDCNAKSIETFRSDEGHYPGEGEPIDARTNQIAKVVDALAGEPRPQGPGGRNAPYMELRPYRIAVRDDDAPPESGSLFRVATPRERRDPAVPKVYLDYWGQPYVYRSNRGQPSVAFIRNPETFDVYSVGPKGVDDTGLGMDGDYIGNW